MKLFLLLFLSAACLLISKGSKLRIINGHEAGENSRPYMAYIKVENRTHEMICGGSLIKKEWVVTAAHCKMPRCTAMVILGEIDPYEYKPRRQSFSVVKYISHPNYDKNTYDNDIQLMKLSKAAKLGNKVQVISLPNTYEDVEAGTICETAGWGMTEKQENAESLMEVSVSVMNRTECQELFKAVKITKNRICTSVGPRGEDSCEGDSGGPLIYNNIFRGILSFGSQPCGKRRGAAVYTRLTKEYVDWINEMTK
ncbi:granzyme A-like [Bufo gargarizans]|uniref:granzyme A-like n=1 Tax=Bufo gargarizans TaxID=30331 RepID=UPI001CF3B22A|nr:granzyme A-like [Bufo gargarizans]